MSTTFSPEEIVQAGHLRNISQKDLQDTINKHEKLGLYFNNNGLSVVLLQYERYKQLVERVEELEDILEEIELANSFGNRAHAPKDEWIKQPADKTTYELYKDFKAGNLKNHE